MILSQSHSGAAHLSDLLVARGRDAGLGLVRALQPLRPTAALLLLLPLVLALTLVLTLVHAGVLHLHFPAAALPQEALVDLQLLTRLLPTVAALHLQLLDAHLDVLDVLRGDPRSGGSREPRVTLSSTNSLIFFLWSAFSVKTEKT